MFSSARGCASKNLHRLRSTSLEIQTPHEPLLFLYPQWFQHAALRADRDHTYRRYTHAARQPRDDQAKRSQQFSHATTSASDHQPAASGASNLSPQGARKQRPRLLNLKNIASRKPIDKRSLQEDGEEEGSAFKSSNMNNFDPAGIDGLELAKKLASIANSSSLSFSESIDTTPQFLEWLVGTSEENMWFHREKSGCRIYVATETKNRSTKRVILLEGSERSRELATRYLHEKKNEYSKTSANLRERLPIPKHKYDETAAKNLSNDYYHVDKVPAPEAWSIKSFYQYVQAILGNRAPRAVERTLYPGNDSFDKAASKHLLETFSIHELKQYQSVAALRLVLAHFSSRTQEAANIVSIWTAALENGLVPDIACLNYEIERSIASGNLNRIEYLLWNMRLFLVKPNTDTWGILLGILQTPAQRRKLISALLRSGHLSTSQDREIMARALIRAEVKTAVAQKDGLPTLAEWLHKRFGKDWLTPGAMCDMIDQCIRSTVPWKVHEVLDIARYFGISLSQLDSTALLDVIRRTGHFRDTKWFFRAMPPARDHITAQSQVTLLFKIAWSQNLFNTCRLIWRYSSSRGLISHPMQKLVVDSLAKNHRPQSSKGTKSATINSKLAAFVIATNMKKLSSKFPKLANHGTSQQPIELLCQWMPNDESRHEQMQLTHLLVDRALRATEWFRPMRFESFRNQLDEVHRLDIQWKMDDTVVNASPAELEEQSIKIGLHRKSKTKLEAEISSMASVVDAKSIEEPTVTDTSESKNDADLTMMADSPGVSHRLGRYDDLGQPTAPVAVVG